MCIATSIAELSRRHGLACLPGSAARSSDSHLTPRTTPPTPAPSSLPAALAAAAQANQYGVVEFLIESKADVNFRTGQQRLPILYAAESGHFQVMNLLIQNGATAFSSFDQQLESYFVSYLIRQGITKRELSAVIPNETAVYTILDYVGLGTQRKPTAVQPQAPLVQGVGDPAAMAAAAAAAAGAQAAAGGPVLMAGGVPAGVAPGPGFEGVAAP